MSYRSSPPSTSARSVRLDSESPGSGGVSARELLRYVFADISEAAIVADPQRRIMMVNDAAVSLFGHPRGQMIGELTRMLYADAAGYELQGQRRYNEGASRHDSYVQEYRRKDGSAFVGETTGGPIRDSRGQILGYLAIIRDATRRVTAGHVLRQLLAITADRKLPCEERLDRILWLGCEHFELPIGIISHIDRDRYTVVRAASSANPIAPGAVFNLQQTYCVHTLNADEAIGFHHVANSELRTHPCYTAFQLEAYVGTPLLVDGDRYGTVNFSGPFPTRAFTAEDLELMSLFGAWVGHELARQSDIDALTRAQEQLERFTNIDELTGLRNRRSTERALDAELRRCMRQPGPLCLAFADWDDLKGVNEVHGHAAGDQVLRAFGELCRSNFREVDVIGRWGGNAFVLLMPATTERDALDSAERLRRLAESMGVVSDGKAVELTLSVGIAQWAAGMSGAELVKNAQTALGQAKQSGRNRVLAYGGSPPGGAREINLEN